MKRWSLFFLYFFAITSGCGQSGKKQNAGQPQEQQAPQEQYQRRGPGGRGRPQFNPEDMAKRQTSQIGEFVKFAEGQEAKVTEINLKYAKMMMENRGQGNFRDMNEAQRNEWRAKWKNNSRIKTMNSKPFFG